MFQVLAYLAIAAALFMAGFGVGSERTSAKVSSVALSQQKADLEERIAAEQRTFNDALKAAKDAMSVNDEVGNRLDFLEVNSRSILERVNRAPRSVMCVNSSAVRAYLDGLRNSAPAASPHGVPDTPEHKLP
jgi:hypothetical protein